MRRSAWIGLLAVAVVLVLFVGAAPGAPDHFYIVNTTADGTNGGCDSVCTLRDAILGANNDNDASQIQFAIPGSGPHTIQLTQALPAITAPVTIDGTTQGNVVAIDGGGVTDLGSGHVTTNGVQGLVLAAGSDGSTIRGLTLGNFEIAGQADPAIEVDSSDNSIVGNTIGTAADGATAAPDQAGILVTGNANIIGGEISADRNVIVHSFSDNSSNDPDGILVKGDGSDFPTTGNKILGNYIGVLADGTTVAKNEESDIQVIDSQNTMIGGFDPADGNVLAGAGSPDAIFLGDFADTSGGNTQVRNNLIGLSADGSTSLGPESANGIDVEDHGTNTIADNTIADMYQGIDICDSPDNQVVGNVIGSNTASPGGPDFGVHDQGISVENGSCTENGTAIDNQIGGDTGQGNVVIDSQLNDVAVDADTNNVSYNTLRGTKGGPVVEVAGSGNFIQSNEITGAKVGSTVGDGVLVDSGNADSIEQNSIHGNQNLGIELVTGANDDQPAPVLGSASVADGAITVQGTYDFPAGGPYTVDVYQSSSCESGGAGETWAGSFTVTANGSSQPFTSPALTAHSPGTVITATATAPDGSTSEFSNCTTLGSAPNVFTVDTLGDTDDGACIPGACSLRDAINASNSYAGPGATIDFDIPGGPAPTITLTDDLPTITAPVTIDGTTQPATPPDTPGVTIGNNGNISQAGVELGANSGGSVVRGLAIRGISNDSHDGSAIRVDSNNDTVAGNWVNTSADGTTNWSGDRGIVVTGQDDTIGGTSAADANSIVNTGPGILLGGATGAVIEGNLVGLTPDGSALGNQTGIELDNASAASLIGGTTAGARNVISANSGDGIDDSGNGTQIEGNLIGLTSDGKHVLGNGSVGIELAGADTPQVQDNVVSGNGYDGLLVGSGTTAATLVGNFIGTDATGTTALGQGSGGSGDGIDVTGASGTMIGGTGPGDRNVISGNTSDGIDVTGGDSTTIEGNYIGTDATGSSAVGNGVNGIYIAVSGNTIGGDSAAAGNVISGNGQFGVQMEGSLASGNTVSGNLIGTDATGTKPLGNSDDGVMLNAGAANNTIGGTDAGAANVISDNGAAPDFGYGGGVDLVFGPGSGNVVEGNLIGTDLSGSSNLGNAHFGVMIDGSGETIGGTVAGAGNTIAFNNGPGVHVLSGNDENAIQQNSIHDNTDLGIKLDAGANDGIAAPTISNVAGNLASGTVAAGAGATVTIELFGNASCDNVNGAGRDFLGSTQVQIGGGGTASWNATLSGLGSDTGVTATVTDPTPDTSEFSACATVGPPVFTVTTTADSNDGSCTPSLCSLRDAVIAANANLGGTIDFSIPSGSVITLQTPLDPITAPVTIDGTTAPGTLLNNPGVTIVPTGNVVNTSLLDLAPGSHGSTVNGLAFGGNSIGSGTTAISAESDQDTITGNWIGIAADSTSVGLGAYGIVATGSNETIGGGTAAAANVITGTVQQAISIKSPDGETQPVTDTIQGNLIGLEPNGTPASGQGNGISVSDSIGTVIGNNDDPASLGDVQNHPELGNVISGMGEAINILGNSRGTIAAGNFIGVDRSGTATSANANGIVVSGASNNQIGPGDTIAHVTHDGVEVVGSGSVSNRIVANSIFDSANTGIDDLQGGNDGIAAPSITSASSVTGVVSGTWSGTNSAFIEVFTNPSCNAPYASGAGKTYVEFVTATPGQTWTATIGGLQSGTGVTATATDASTVDTSAFSNCLTASTVPQLTNLNVSVTGSPAGAGIDQVPISAIPNAWLSFYAGTTNSSPVGSTPVGSTPVGSTPVGSTPVGSTPVGSTPVGSTPVGSTPVGSTPVGSTGLLALPVGSTPVGSTALNSLLLSQIPLCGDTPVTGTNQATCISDGATWAKVLAGTSFAGLPLNSVTLADLVSSPDHTAANRLAALPLRDVSFATSLFQSVHWQSLLLGPTPLESLPPPSGFDSWCGGTNPAVPADGGSCANVTPSTTVLQMDVGGQLGSAPVGSTPVGSTPVGSTPVGSTPVGSTKVSESRLATILLADIATYDGDLNNVVDCSNPSINCSSPTQTLGDAYAASAIKPSATFANIQHTMDQDGITYDDVLIAILGAAGLPWEQLSLQGLQPYSQTPSTVHYTISTHVDCSAVSQFTLTARLPDGFFPVNNSAKASVGNTAPTSAGVPTVDEKNNGYRWTLNCPGGDNSVETATLTFDSWVGLDLGTFSTTAIAATGSFSISQNGAPVTVHQNSEAQDPSSATQINQDTLVAGHIAFGGEQAFYKVNLTGLPSGTRISAFLNVPSDADLDLTMSAPAAASLDASPVGSTPVGSTPIADTGAGFTADGQALSPDTLQDVPVGSTPVGSTPVGSTPVGSTSDSRGAGVNESGAIITNGQSGFVTIGVSGYNGASSDKPFVLRVQETPPPQLPTCPARSLTVSASAQGTLPATVSSSTKTLFILDQQRLTAMYGATAVSNMLTSLKTLAARSEVSGAILPVDGNAAVRSAYSAWDASPCDTSARNNVVKAINDVVAGYRANNALPNLHYIVLLGSDEATPMADTPDPVLLSPEEDEASGLAFTTNGGTQGNALYASAAHNQILTDGAYGAFTNIQWLGQALLLPQLSVSRLVESPSDILGQINRYLKANGYTGTPQSGVGTLNPTSASVTGYDFLADGSQSVANNLAHQFGLTVPSTFSDGHSSIYNPLTKWKALTTYPAGATVQPTSGSPNLTFQTTSSGTSGMLEPAWPTTLGGTVVDGGVTWKAIATPVPWSATDVINNILASATPASIDALNGHYNQYELEAADGSLATTAQATSANLAARILFTMGCHGGLNVADTLPGGSTTSPSGQYLDWPELYSKDQAAMYIGNTGFGYGDTASIALSERLLALYARNLHSNSDSVGEQWAETLGQYFATAGAYDVYDEKVMEETTFYGLPFWHFGTAPVTPLSGSLSSANSVKPLTRASGANPNVASASSLSTTTDPITGTPSATVTFPATGDTTQSQFGLYRPILSITSQEVTSTTGPATGLWIKSLASSDTGNVTPTIGYPTIDLSAHEPIPDVKPIFFPASPFTLEHSYVFGNERDYLNVSDQFRPNDPNDGKGTQRHFVSGQFEVFYGNTSDQISPLISDVTSTFAAGAANIAVRVTDPSSPVVEVAVLVNDGMWHYVQLTRSSDPTLWTGSISNLAEDPEIFAEATDGTNVSYSANKGSNFTSVPAGQPAQPLITLSSPFGTYFQGSSASATFSCSGGFPGVAQCNATLDGNPIQSGAPINTATPGEHTFVVTALDADGNVVATLQRTYAVAALTSCLTGSLSGSLTVKSGVAYCIQGGKVSGSITVQNGGALYISGGTVSGSITATGATALTLCGTSVSGTTSVSSSTGLVQLGGPSGSGCAANKISGSVSLTGNADGVIVSGNKISASGGVVVTNTSGGVTFTNNTISGSVSITNNTGGFAFSGNTISGTVTLHNNT